MILLTTAWLLIRTAKIQTLIAKKIIEKFEERIDADIKIGLIKAKFPKNVQIDDLVIWDQLGDTLISAPQTTVNIRSYNLKELDFELGEVKFKDPFIYLQEDPGGGLNLSFILKEIISDSAKLGGLNINKVVLEDAHFKFHKFNTRPDPGKFSIDYTELYNVNIRISDFSLVPDSIQFNIEKLNASEISGFRLDRFKGEFQVINGIIEGRGIEIETENSQFESKKTEIRIGKEKELSFLDQLNMVCSIKSGTTISERDIAFFLKDFSGFRDIDVHGDISYQNASIRWRDAYYHYDDLSEFSGELKINNMDNKDNLEFDLSVESLNYSPKFHNATLAGLLIDPDTLNLPISMDSTETLFFEGSFKGTIQSFTTQGSFKSDLGDLMGYVITDQGSTPDAMEFRGAVVGSVYDPKDWLATSVALDTVKFDAKFFGEYESMDFHTIDTDVSVHRVGFNDYQYEDIQIVGQLINRRFDSEITIRDENLDLALNTQFSIIDSIANVDFELVLNHANLADLNFNKLDSVEFVGANVSGSFKGSGVDDIEGQLWASDCYYQNSRGALPIDEISLAIGAELNQKRVTFISDYIDARLFGDVHIAELVPQIIGAGKRFLPVNMQIDEVDADHENNFTFNINLKNPRPLTEILTPAVVFRENTSLSGFFRDGGQDLFIEGILPQFLVSDKLFTDLTFTMVASEDSVSLTGNLDKLQFNSLNELKNLDLGLVLVPDQADLLLSWNDSDSVTTQGILQPSLYFEKGTGTWPKMYIDFPETEVHYKDTLWNMDAFQMSVDKSVIRFNSLNIHHNSESLMVNGSVSDIPEDTLHVEFNKLNMAHLEAFTGSNKRFSFEGVVDGDAKIFDIYDKGLFLADIAISDFKVNGELLGETRILSNRQADSDEIFMEVSTQRGDISTIGLSGYFNPINDRLNFDINLDKLRMNVFNAVLDPVLKDIRGIASGFVSVAGTRSDPVFNGEINMQKAAFYVNYINTRYTFTHPVKITPNGFWVENLIARDKDGNEAIVNGGVGHDKFKNVALDFKIDADHFLSVDTDESMNLGFWGTAYATGVVTLGGPLKNIRIDVNAQTESGTDLSIPVSKTRNVRKVDFIKYVEKEVVDELDDLISYTTKKKRDEYEVDLSGLELNLDIAVTPDARAQIIIDSESGNTLRAYGRGNLNITVDTRGVFALAGEYLIDDGDYQLTLENMALKRFDIEPGGSVLFNGPINAAAIDVDAIYRANAALYDLILDDTNPDLRQRTPVECHLLMTGLLANPNLEFDIVLPPNSDDIARSQLNNLAQEDIQKQLFSLLILNQFSPLPGISSGNPRSYEGAGLKTTTEMLSNQLNNLLSEITSDFDIGFNYLPGDELTSDEVAVALRAQLLENRMIINVNGNVDVRSVETDANQLVGDVEVEYKITPSGKLRVKAFTRANDRLLYEYSLYTQGFGIFFREEFNTFGELFNKYWDSISNNRRRNTKKD